MRVLLPLALLLACAACGRDADVVSRAAVDAGNDPDLPGAASAPAARLDPAIDPTAAAAGMPQVSPVPSFRGGASDWQIQLHSAHGLRHDVSLQWDGQTLPGLVEFRLPAVGPKPDTYRLDGLLYTPQGDVGLSIQIAGGSCSDASEPGGARHDHTVQVIVQGRAQLRGCGDLAAY